MAQNTLLENPIQQNQLSTQNTPEAMAKKKHLTQETVTKQDGRHWLKFLQNKYTNKQ